MTGQQLFAPHRRGSTAPPADGHQNQRVCPAQAGVYLHIAGLGIDNLRLPRTGGDRPLEWEGFYDRAEVPLPTRG